MMDRAQREMGEPLFGPLDIGTTEEQKTRLVHYERAPLVAGLFWSMPARAAR